MKRLAIFVLALLVIAAVALTATASQRETVEFKRAQLRVEINATDGDAGLQIDLDHEPWRSLTVRDPDGKKILDVVNHGVLKGYGLTELFSESSEPAFDEFPLEEFQKLFPAGGYTFEGLTIDGIKMMSTVTLTHDFPAGPEFVSPVEDSDVPADGLVVEWLPVTAPAGIQIVAYQVLVILEDDPTKVFSATLPTGVTSMAVPAEFLTIAGEYKAEVLAIEQSGNQTLSEVAFTVG
ncbi:MAG: hypothetical protein Q8Q52_00765 [Acidimicrobiia bacterium]|nr:hypothetical protein [Acidimicrobiia bacterium]